jgi:hypothetical protein
MRVALWWKKLGITGSISGITARKSAESALGKGQCLARKRGEKCGRVSKINAVKIGGIRLN